jgi:hypothetical protein
MLAGARRATTSSSHHASVFDFAGAASSKAVLRRSRGGVGPVQWSRNCAHAGANFNRKRGPDLAPIWGASLGPKMGASFGPPI